ncbi:hypothetical protein ACSBR2_011270 [Camellia fascicularis]
MAENVVFHLLAYFAPFFQQKANLLTGVRDESQYIRDEFDRMTAFLRVTAAMEENNPELKAQAQGLLVLTKHGIIVAAMRFYSMKQSLWASMNLKRN